MEHLDHPSPHFNDAKMVRFCSFAPSSLLWGGGGKGIIVPFYSVQDCSLEVCIFHSQFCVFEAHCKVQISISQSTAFSFRKIQISISQSTAFSFCKVQIFISQSIIVNSTTRLD